MLRAFSILHAVAIVLLLPGASATAIGAVKLDNYTFDKMIKVPGLSILVKFDQSYAYGEKEDAFKELCKLGYSVPNFLIAEVPVQEYGDKENDDLRERYNLKKEDFPIFFLFKDSKEPIKYAGLVDPNSKKPANWDDDEDGAWEPPMLTGVTTEALNMWLRTNGIKMPSIGTIAELDEVAQRVMKDGLKDTDLEEANKLANGDYKNDKKAQIYVKIMEKIKEKGKEYVDKESARVTKIMAGKITPEKEAEMKEKLNILKVFRE